MSQFFTTSAGASGSGDVTGPGASTDNAIVRWDGASGTIIQNSGSTLSDAGLLSTGELNLTTDLAVIYGGTGQSSYVDGQLLIGNSTGNTLDKATLTSGTGISIANSGGTITISNSAAGDIQFQTSSGTATVDSGVLVMTNGTGISMAGSGNTLTINAAADVPTIFNTDSGSASPVGNTINLFGADGIVISGTGSTVTFTNGTDLTAGSVVFSDGTSFAEDNANFFWDDTNNRLGIGTTTPADELHVVGGIDLDHTAVGTDEHAIEVICDAAGFGDVKALEIDYVTGALSAVSEDGIILVNIDETASLGGEVFGIEINATAEGSASVYGTKHGATVNPVFQESGVFADADSILNKAVDVTAALASGGAGNISLFVADNDTVTIGDAATYGEFEIIIDTGASGAGIAPTFEYSLGVGTWAAFTPTDGTDGFKFTGVISWDPLALTSWAVGTGSEYLVRITRTKNSLSTTPIVDEIQKAAVTQYTWDKNGDLSVNNVNLASGGAYSIDSTSVLNATTLGSAVVASSLTSVGTIATGVWQGTAVTEPYGGTNQTTYTTGDILYSDASNSLEKLAIGSTDEVLKVAAGIPSWGSVPAGSGSGLVFLASATASTSSSLDFTSSIDSTYNMYMFVFDDLTASTVRLLYLRTSTDGGSTFDSGAADYEYQLIKNDDGTLTGQSSATTAMSITTLGTSQSISGRLFLHNPSATTRTLADFTVSVSVNQTTYTGSANRDSTADVDAVQFLPSAGTFVSGTIYMYGMTTPS